MTNIIEASVSINDSEAEIKAKTYYTSCMDFNNTIESLGAEPLQDLLRWLGGWMINSASSDPLNVTDWNFQATLEKIHGFGLYGFFNMWVSSDEKVLGKNVLQVIQEQTKESKSHFTRTCASEQRYRAWGGEGGCVRLPAQKLLHAHLHWWAETSVGREKERERHRGRETWRETGVALYLIINRRLQKNRPIRVSKYPGLIQNTIIQYM